MKTSIRLEAIFPLEEQLDIVGTVSGIKQKYDEEKTPKTRRYYFRQLAEKYQLANRVLNQLELYRNNILKKEELTNNLDLAKLFGVRPTAIESYLTLMIPPKELKERASLCLEAGRTVGWNYLVNSGQLHKLTKQDITKKKRKNDKHKRDN